MTTIIVTAMTIINYGGQSAKFRFLIFGGGGRLKVAKANANANYQFNYQFSLLTRTKDVVGLYSLLCNMRSRAILTSYVNI